MPRYNTRSEFVWRCARSKGEWYLYREGTLVGVLYHLHEDGPLAGEWRLFQGRKRLARTR